MQRKILLKEMANKGINQKDLTNIIGLKNRSYVSHLIACRLNPSLKVAHALSAYFGLPIEELLAVE